MNKNDFAKPEYSKEEMKELADWFDRHKDQWPEEFRFDKGSVWRRARHTIDSYVHLARTVGTNPTFRGQMCQLFYVRAMMQEQGVKD